MEYLDSARRTVYVIGEVDPAMALGVIQALEKLDQTEGPIRVVINSEGGVEADGYAIYDAITMCKNQVIVVGYGGVFSIAAAIFQAADHRIMMPNSSMMVHNGTAPIDGDAKQNEVIDLAEQLKRDNARYYTILSSRSQQTQEFFEEACRTDTYFTAEETVKLGLADEVAKPPKSWFQLPKPKRNRRKK